MSLLFEVLDRHARAMLATSEVMGLVSERLNQREERLADLFDRVERRAEAMEPLLRSTWRWVLTGMAWAVVGGLVGANSRRSGGRTVPGAGAMRLWIPMLGCILAAAPAAAQGLRAPVASDAAPLTVSTRMRHVSTIMLPETAEIVEVVAGDPEQWDVSAAAHLVFLRPLVEGARSNVVLLTAAGDVVPVALVESADAAVDAVVRVGTAEAGEAHGEPVLASAEAVEAMAVQAAETWAAVAAAEAQAADRVEAARIAALEQLDESREAYPRQLQFDYRWPDEAADYPWLVEGMWHDGLRTYLRTRAISPVLHERTADGLGPVDASAVLDDVLYVVPRVLGSGALEVGGRRLTWTARPRKAGP